MTKAARMTDEQIAELESAFDAHLMPKSGDWRDRIDTWISADKFELCQRACEFYTGTGLVWTGEQRINSFTGRRQTRVRATGYRGGPAGP